MQITTKENSEKCFNFIAILMECNRKLNYLDDVLGKPRALKNALMQNLLTGKKRVITLLNYMEVT